MAKSPSIYSLAEIIILSIIITAMMIVIVVGNMLVIIAIATENNLTTVQNWFIASLAMADMMIGLVIMPFSLRCVCYQNRIMTRTIVGMIDSIYILRKFQNCSFKHNWIKRKLQFKKLVECLTFVTEK